jgi:transcription initiation factor TFIID subunit 11
MQRVRVAELASRQAELASDDDISTSSTSSSEHYNRVGKSASGSTLNVESGEEGVAEDEDDALYDMHHTQNVENREDELRGRIGTAQERMHDLIQSFDEDQMQRYETFRRVGIPRPAVKRLIQRVIEQSNVNANCVIILAGIAKIFVGEVVECALEVAEEWSQNGVLPGWGEGDPLLPSHLLEAHRRLQARNPAYNAFHK